MEGKLKDEAAAAAFLGFDADMAMVKLEDTFADPETQAASQLLVFRRRGLFELLKNRVELVRRDSAARILDPNFDPAAPPVDFQCHASLVRSEFISVPDQVVQ